MNMPPCLQDMVNYYVKKKPIPDSQTDLADHRWRLWTGAVSLQIFEAA